LPTRIDGALSANDEDVGIVAGSLTGGAWPFCILDAHEGGKMFNGGAGLNPRLYFFLQQRVYF
jgi:hypothetical protein